MAYWTCQFTFSWVCESPLVLKGLIILSSLQRLRLYTDWAPVQSLQGSVFPWTETFHPEKGFLVLDGAQDAESRCWCWSSANMCRRPRTQIVRMNREREMFAFEMWVSNGGESYKKYTSRTEPGSQGQTPVRQAHVQHCSFGSTAHAVVTLSPLLKLLILYCAD